MIKTTYKTGLKKNIVNKKIFNREVTLCQNLSKGDKKCSWGECKKCGVIPLLYKLYKGELLEDSDVIEKVKSGLLK